MGYTIFLLVRFRLFWRRCLFFAFSVCPTGFCTTMHRDNPITVGSKAACTGLLWPVPWSTKALRCLDVDLPKLTAENTLLSGSLAACSKRLDGLSLLCDQKLGELTTLVENSAKLNSTQWYESPVFWGIVSFVAGGAIVIGVYELAGR